MILRAREKWTHHLPFAKAASRLAPSPGCLLCRKPQACPAAAARPWAVWVSCTCTACTTWRGSTPPPACPGSSAANAADALSTGSRSACLRRRLLLGRRQRAGGRPGPRAAAGAGRSHAEGGQREQPACILCGNSCICCSTVAICCSTVAILRVSFSVCCALMSF